MEFTSCGGENENEIRQMVRSGGVFLPMEMEQERPNKKIQNFQAVTRSRRDGGTESRHLIGIGDYIQYPTKIMIDLQNLDRRIVRSYDLNRAPGSDVASEKASAQGLAKSMQDADAAVEGDARRISERAKGAEQETQRKRPPGSDVASEKASAQGLAKSMQDADAAVEGDARRISERAKGAEQETQRKRREEEASA
ncbi:hypothetical protein KSP40_PGU006619 [Platanthera guangdongensis]|uniref:Uncharacterized protein n=1 Tax=Platanthera guangdongensis TaxID=2320717 RepID=A0ABR2MAB9_9ASPA